MSEKLLPTTFSKTGEIVKSKAEPVKTQTFQDGDDGPTRARQLGALQKDVAEATEATRLNRWNQARYFEDITVSAAVDFSVEHKLGRKVYYSVVRWAPAAAGTPIANPPPIISETSDKLSLYASASGTLTLAVW